MWWLFRSQQDDEDDSRATTQIRRIAEQATFAWLWRITAAVVGVLGVSVASVAGYVFFYLPDAAYHRALEVVANRVKTSYEQIESRTRTAFEQIEKRISDTSERLAEIGGQTKSLNSDLPQLRELNQQTKIQLGEIKAFIGTYRETIATLQQEQAAARAAFVEFNAKREQLVSDFRSFDLVKNALPTLQNDFNTVRDRLGSVNSYSPQDIDSFRHRIELSRAWASDEEIRNKLQACFKIASDFDPISRLVKSDRHGNEVLLRAVELLKKDSHTHSGEAGPRRDLESRMATIETVVGKPSDSTKTLSVRIEALEANLFVKPLTPGTKKKGSKKTGSKKKRGKK